MLLSLQGMNSDLPAVRSVLAAVAAAMNVSEEVLFKPSSVVLMLPLCVALRTLLLRRSHLVADAVML